MVISAKNSLSSSMRMIFYCNKVEQLFGTWTLAVINGLVVKNELCKYRWGQGLWVNHSQYSLSSLHLPSCRIAPAMLLRYSPTPLSLVATQSKVSFSRSPSFQFSPKPSSNSQPLIRVLSSSALRRRAVACCAAMEDSTNSSVTLESPHKLRLLFVEMGTGYDQHGFVSCPRNFDYRVQCFVSS